MKEGSMILKEFIQYFLMFYGNGGMYANYFKKSPLTEKEARLACEFYAVNNESFCGDSFDREHIRDILLRKKGIL